MAKLPGTGSPPPADGNGARSVPVATRRPPAASLLELPALGSHVGLGVAVGHAWRPSEVFLSLTGLHRATQEHGALPEGGAQGELVECDALATCLADAGAGRLREPESADTHFL